MDGPMACATKVADVVRQKCLAVIASRGTHVLPRLMPKEYSTELTVKSAPSDGQFANLLSD